MRSRLLISEQERSEILSLYRLLNENQTAKISGIVDPGESWKLKSPTQNLKIDLYSDVSTDSSEVLGDEDDIVDLVLIETTRSDFEGKFYFDNLEDTSNLIVRFEGNSFYNKSEVKLKEIPLNKETKVTLKITRKPEVYTPIESEDEETKPNKFCKKKESTEKNIFGLGFYEEKTYPSPDSILKYDKEKFIANANNVGILDAFNTYLTLYPNDKVTAQKMLDTMDDPETDSFSTPKYKVPCKKVFSEKGNFVASTSVKFKKKNLDELVNYIIEKEKPKKEILKFDDYDFQTALQYSYNWKRKIFLFVCSDMSEECKTLYDEFTNSDLAVQKFKGYIRLYYKVDRSETKKFVLSSEALDIDTYPTIVVLEATKDPSKTPIMDSVKILKKTTEFDNLEEKINYLTS